MYVEGGAVDGIAQVDEGEGGVDSGGECVDRRGYPEGEIEQWRHVGEADTR